MLARRKNFHLPLDPDLYRRLRLESVRTGRPATDLARAAIEAELTRRQRMKLHEEIAEYAAGMAGTTADLDPALERAATEHLAGRRGRRRK